MSTDASAYAIIFFGTPSFAVPSLKALVQSTHQVRAVVTVPDKPSGRGLKLTSSAVKEAALELGLPIIQPVSLDDPGFLRDLSSLKPDLQVVVAFKKLPERVWKLPAVGTMNLHASLLPDYRGAAPINWAIMNGEIETGLTTFFIDDQIDTGQILLQKRMFVGNELTAGELHDRMMVAGAELLLETIDRLRSGTLTATPQELLINGDLLHKAPKLRKSDCHIQWDQTCHDLHNKIRGLSPFPGAYGYFGQKGGKAWLMKILQASCILEPPDAEPGSIQTDGRTFIRVACKDGYIMLKRVQLEGKRALSINEFLNGYTIDLKQQFSRDGG